MFHGALVLLDGIPKPGEVRAQVWDRFTTWGQSVKGGSRTEFSLETLSEIVDNFVGRGVLLPMDWRHETYKPQSTYGGQSLARYSALAVVKDGKVAKFGALKDYQAPQPDAANLGDGLYGFRCEVTPLGQTLLPNVRYISPAFSPKGVDEQEESIGYELQCVAATDTPFQGDRGDGAPEITFQKGKPMPLSAKQQIVAKLVGLEKSTDPKEVHAAFLVKMGKDAAECMAADEAYNYDAAAAKMEDEAKAFEDAHFEDDGDADNVGKMRKMAAKFRHMGRMAKMAAEPKDDDDAKKEMGKRLGVDPSKITFEKVLQHFDAKMVGADQVAKLEKEIVALKEQNTAREVAEKKSAAKLFAQEAIRTFRTTAEKGDVIEKVYIAEGAAEAEKLLFPPHTFSALRTVTAGGHPNGKDPTPTQFSRDSSSKIGVEFDRAVKDLMAKEKLDYSTAMDRVYAEQPHLYARDR